MEQALQFVPGKDEYQVRARGRTGLDAAIPIVWARMRGLKATGTVKWVPHPVDPDILMMKIIKREGGAKKAP